MTEQTKDPRQFTTQHVWIRLDEEQQQATVGISSYRMESLPEILSLDLPEPEDEIEATGFCMHLYLENDRIIHLRAPLTGRILEVNKEVLDNCSLLHLDPDKYWLFIMEYDNPDEIELLMDAKQYEDYLEEKGRYNASL